MQNRLTQRTTRKSNNNETVSSVWNGPRFVGPGSHSVSFTFHLLKNPGHSPKYLRAKKRREMLKLSYFQYQLIQISFVDYWLLLWRVLKFVKASCAEKYIFIFCINIFCKTVMTETTILKKTLYSMYIYMLTWFKDKLFTQ